MSTWQDEQAAVATPEVEGEEDGALRALAGGVESILFVAGGPVSVDNIAEALGADRAAVVQAIHYLQRRSHGTGLLIQAVAGGYQPGELFVLDDGGRTVTVWLE